MNNIKSKKVINGLTLITIFILFFLGAYANFSLAGQKDNDIWNVKITSEGKDLTFEDTQDIKFITKNNNNVVSGKIAPGSILFATVDLDLTGTQVAVDLDIEIDESLLSNQFELNYYLDDEKIIPGETKVIELENDNAFTEENGKKTITLELTWKDSDQDTVIGINTEKINIPVTITVSEHI